MRYDVTYATDLTLFNIESRVNMSQLRKVSLHEKVELATLLDGFKLATFNDQATENTRNVTVTPSNTAPTAENQSEETESGINCLTCKCSLPERENQVLHYRSDWHRYNLKLRLLGKPAIDENELADIIDTLSISGSESEDEENVQFSVSLLKGPSNGSDQIEQFDNQTPKLYFENSSKDILSVYKKILYNKQKPDGDLTSVTLQALEAAHNQFWAVILFSAGHFAASVFEGSKVTVHKTFHQYIVRAKRGTVQSVRDGLKNKGNTARSAGANLRRQNEAALEEGIKSLLKSWKDDHLDKCTLIFLRVPHYRKSLFYGGKDSFFNSKDSRIRSIPFATRRPTHSEVQRIHRELFSVTLHDKNSFMQTFSPTEKPKKSQRSSEITNEIIEARTATDSDGSDEKVDLVLEEQVTSTSHLEIFQAVPDMRKLKNKNKNKNKRLKEEDDANVLQLSKEDNLSAEEQETIRRLYTACSLPDLSVLDEILASIRQTKEQERPEIGKKADENGVTTEKRLSNPGMSLLCHHIDNKGNTLLHIASKLGHTDVILKLLDAGSDPTIKNFASVPPYCVCSSKEARKVYRRFWACHPDRYDYKQAQVPSPLSEEQEEEMKKKQNEKKKAQKAVKKERKKRMEEEEERRREEQSEKERFLALSDREKRLIAVERRMLKDPNAKISNERRCYTCGENLFAKVPFEYFEFQFCSIKCLKAHKSKNKT